MPKKARELSSTEVRRLTQPGFYAVGGCAGLHLYVKRAPELDDRGRETRPAVRSWVLRVVAGGRRRDFGLGGFPDVPLSQARERARETREQLRQGIDPVAARKAAQDALRAADAKRMTFDEAALKCWQARSKEFRSVKHAAQWKATIDLYASPVIGKMQIADIEVAHVVDVLDPIWLEKTETASRLRGRIETVLEWARVAGYRNGLDNPASWKTLKHILPKPSKVKTETHYPALPWAEIPVFVAELRKREGMAARALEFAILTAARSGEVRLATWDEIDLDAKLWTVPGERMKAGLAHKVPLSDPAVKLLKVLPRMADSPYVFPAPRGGALSDMSLSAVVRRMHEDDVKAGGKGWLDPTSQRIATPHGIARSCFKDWARSSTSYPDEVSELALAHISDDKTRSAYARDELLPKRTRLMRDWARFLATVPNKASVTPIGRRRRG